MQNPEPLRFLLLGRRPIACSLNGHVLHTIKLNRDNGAVCSLSLLTSFAVRVQNLLSWFWTSWYFFFFPGRQIWGYLIWHALLCFLRCSQSCSGWYICIRCTLFLAPGNGAVAFEHSSFTWHGLYSAGRKGGTASVSNRCFRWALLVKNKVFNIFDCERHRGRRQTSTPFVENLTHWHKHRYKFLFSAKVYPRQINIKSDKQKEFNILVDALKVETFFPKTVGKRFIYLFTFFLVFLLLFFLLCD